MRPFIFSGLLLAALLVVQPTLLAQVHGEGNVIREAIELDDFHSIGLGLDATVYLTPGESQRVVVEGQRNVIELLKREVRNGSWEIAFDRRVRNYERLTIRITMPTVENLSIGGSGEIVTEAAFRDLNTLEFAIGGSGSITFAGSAKRLEVSIGGSGTVQAEDLSVDNCEVSIGGSGNAYVDVSENLNVSIAGSGDVVYKGRPKVRSAIAGGGQVRSN